MQLSFGRLVIQTQGPSGWESVGVVGREGWTLVRMEEYRMGAGLPVTPLLSALPSSIAHVLRGTGLKPKCGLHGGLQPGRVGDIER